MRPEALILRRADDGTITVDEFVPTIHIIPELVCHSALIDTIITITVANGSARYRITDYDDNGWFVAVRIDDDAR